MLAASVCAASVVWSISNKLCLSTTLALQVGAILVNINPSYRANELAFALRQSGVCVLVMASELRGTSFPDVLESVAEEAPKIRHKVVLGAEPPAGEWIALRLRKLEELLTEVCTEVP